MQYSLNFLILAYYKIHFIQLDNQSIKEIVNLTHEHVYNANPGRKSCWVQVKFPTNWLLSKSSNVIQKFEIIQSGTPIVVHA